MEYESRKYTKSLMQNMKKNETEEDTEEEMASELCKLEKNRQKVKINRLKIMKKVKTNERGKGENKTPCEIVKV